MSCEHDLPRIKSYTTFLHAIRLSLIRDLPIEWALTPPQVSLESDSLHQIANVTVVPGSARIHRIRFGPDSVAGTGVSVTNVTPLFSQTCIFTSLLGNCTVSHT